MLNSLRFLLCLLAIFCWESAFAQETISLAGPWGFQLDPTDFERAFENSGAHRDRLAEQVMLPGTTDTLRKGVPTTSRPINRLSRLYEYAGPAWYQRDIEIPSAWAGKTIELFLERVLWISSIYIDGVLAGEMRSFSTPHVHELSSTLSPGRHNIAICIDNRVPPAFDRWSHAFSEYTQTAWNGIVGKIELRARDSASIQDIQVYPDVDQKKARIVCRIGNNNLSKIEGTITLAAEAIQSPKPHRTPPATIPFAGSEKTIRVEAEIPMGDEVQLWDEFSPVLYRLKASLSVSNTRNSLETTFGMRKFASEGAHFTINNRKTFLRGTLECAVFPLTGYPEMSVEGWLRICRIIKEHGLNHIRFHSWCPPEAAFAAADQAGVYLQAELPAWTEMGRDKMLNDFFDKEMDRVLAAYGNHPSFVLFCVGNELRGDFDYMARLIARGKQADSRHLYSGSTARKHLPEDQYYVSHVTSAGGITTYGARGPRTDYDLRKAYDVLKVPGVAHEAGQRAVYPNFEEIPKYTGVLYPRNFELFRDTLAAHGMAQQARDFFHVSGQLTALLYKESLEALLRTPNCGGFQLLGLSDFPGQGTALVGILDPFWDSKGILAPEQFREFCGPTVPILRLPKRAYFNDEAFSAQAELCHFGSHPFENLQSSWEIRTEDRHIVASGQFDTRNVAVGALDPLGAIHTRFTHLAAPHQLTITVTAGTNATNSWKIWVYPRQLPEEDETGFVTARSFDAAAIEALQAGKKVLLLPDLRQLQGKKTEFQNHFWCPIMFRWEPMSMGALVRHKHPVYADFATDFFTDWQWWEILENSKTLDLDAAPRDFLPLLQIIDTYDRCLKQGVVFEARVGGGKFLMAAIDFEKNREQRPASRQLLHSIKKYVSSAAFNPSASLDAASIARLFKKPSLTTGAKVLLADSCETGNEPANAIDDNPDTLWHTAYSSPGTFAVTSKQPESDYPHEIQIELAAASEFGGFTYVPRKDGFNGFVAQYEFYASDDGKTWGMPVAKGFFSRTADEKTVLLAQPCTARYVRFVALRGFEGQKWASMAELKLVPVEK